MKYLILGLSVIIGLFYILKLYSRYKMNRVKNRLRVTYGELEVMDVKAEDIESIHASYQYLKREDDIDDITWSDLDLEEIFWRINSTQSSLGDEWLYARLHRQIPDDLHEIDQLIKYFDASEEDRLNVQVQLNYIGKHTGHNTYEFLEHINSIRSTRSYLYLGQMIVFVTSILLCFIIPDIGIPLALFSFLLNNYTYYALNPNQKYEKNLQLIGSAIGICAHLKKTTSFNDDNPYFKQFNALIRVLSPISKTIKRSTGTSMASESGMMFKGLDAAFLITPTFMSISLKLIQKHKQNILDLFEVLGAFDGTIATASYKHTLPYFCEPTFTSNDTLEYDALVNPLLSDKNGVSNSATTHNKLIFTGSNASGKSTFIKALALNAHLGQTLNVCCAKRYAYKPGYIYTSMALRDNVLSGKSYFIVELESLKRIVNAIHTHDHCIVVVDEILRGTNTIERIAASSSILESIRDSNAVVCVATHDIELTQILNGSYDNYHFRETVGDGGISFDYKLHEGPSTTTNAIKLLAYMDFDAQIVDTSNQRVDQFKQHKSWR